MSEPRNARAVSLLFRIWSHFYDNPIPQELYYRRVHRRIVRRWRPRAGEKVLDVGCGTGLFLKSLANEHPGLELTGVDFSEAMLARARGGTGGLASPPTFVHGSVYELPFSDGAFDVVLNTISCHFYLEQVEAFREIARVLAPGGRFYCAAITFGLRGAHSAIANVAVYHEPPELASHLRKAGLVVVGQERMLPNIVLFTLEKP